MPKRKLIRQSEFPYHVVTRNNNKDWFQIPIHNVWDICKESIVYALKKETVVIHAFVLMSNHYHLLISTPKSNIDKFMMHFNWKMSDLINRKSHYINHKFSNRYKWSIVDKQSYLYNVYRYIYQNPVRANLSKDCLTYPYSSLHFTNSENEIFNFKPHFNYSDCTAFFERRFGDEFDRLMTNSLRKAYFKPAASTSQYHMKLLHLSN